MADPIPASTLVQILRAEGCRVVEYKEWRTHHRPATAGKWGPINGVMIHHTVTSGTASSVELCYRGHSTLPGPLCHGVIAKDGTIYLVGNGRANHAGLGDDDVLRAVINESADLPPDNEANVDGNARFYGFECVNMGDGEDPWPAEQLDGIERAAAAICRHYGWSARSVIGHLEWQPGKVDPRGFSMASMRTRIQARLGVKPQPTPAPAPSTTTTYTVKRGDTLWSISQEYDTTVEALRKLNGLKTDTIVTGQKIKVKGTATVPAKPAAPKYEPFPGSAFFKVGRKSPIITAMGRRLVAEGCGRYKQGPGPEWTEVDRQSYAAWQRKKGYSGEDADGIPGKSTWDALKVPNV